MCESSLPAEPAQIPKTCADCGADLSRWTRTAQQPPPIPVDLDWDQDSRRPAKNGLYCLAAFWAIPASLFIACIALGGLRDSIILSFTTLTISLCVMSVIAALKVGDGERSGKLWAFLPIAIVMLNFPIGTLLGYKVYSRLADAELN
jgi:hypothetical protein